MGMELVNSTIQIDFFLELSVTSVVLFLYLVGWKKLSWKYPLVFVMEIIIVGIAIYFFHRYDDWGLGVLQQYFLSLFIFLAQMILLSITNCFFGGLGWNVGFFITFASYLVEHTAHSLSLIVQMCVAYVHNSGIGYLEIPLYQSKLILLACYLVFLFLEIWLLRKVKDNYHNVELKIKQQLPMFACLAGFGLVLNMATKISMYDIENASTFMYLLFVIGIIYDVLCSCFMFWLQVITLDNQYLAKEVELERRLRRLQQQHFLTSKTSIELINQKCHALKHQIQEMREEEDSEAIQKSLFKLEQDIMIYNAIVKTGNEVVDIAVNEKSLLCEKEGITLTCMLDGRPFLAMDALDIYQMFKIILDIAIEKTREVADPNKKLIAITQSKQGMMSFIQVECYWKNQLEIKESLDNTQFLNEIVERYSGEIKTSIKGEIWMMNLMLRLSQLEQENI